MCCAELRGFAAKFRSTVEQTVKISRVPRAREEKVRARTLQDVTGDSTANPEVEKCERPPHYCGRSYIILSLPCGGSVIHGRGELV